MSGETVTSESALNKQLTSYFVKGIVFVAGLLALSALIPIMPSWAIALVWALLSAFAAMGVAYGFVIRKTHRQVKYQRAGQLDKFNKGRFFCLLGSFLLSAILVAGLIFEVPRWSIEEWVIVLLAVPLYCAIALFFSKRLQAEYRPTFRTSGVIFWASILTALLLCAAFFGLLFLAGGSSADSPLQAYLSEYAPYENYQSGLMKGLGRIAALSTGLTSYAIEKTAAENFLLAIGWRMVVGASALFAVSNLLSTCSMNRQEIKRVFQPLEDLTVSDDQSSKRVKWRYVFFAALWTTCLFGVYLYADSQMKAVTSSKPYMFIEDMVQSTIGKSVVTYEGKRYDGPVILDKLVENAELSQQLHDKAKEELTPLINAAFDQELANVDSYLDWYYALGTDHGDDSVKWGIDTILKSGIDFARIDSLATSYSEEARNLEDNQRKRLFEKELVFDERLVKNAWLLADEEPLDPAIIDESFAPMQGLLNELQPVDSSSAPKEFFREGILDRIPVVNSVFDRDGYRKAIEDTIAAKREQCLQMLF